MLLILHLVIQLFFIKNYYTIYIFFMEKILIVDDDESLLKSASRSLRQDGYDVIVASSSDRAIELLKEHRVSVVVSDYMMPKVDGLTLLKKIRIEYPDILLIMLTAVSDINVAVEAINNTGIFKFLLKPIKFSEFKNAITMAVKVHRIPVETRGDNDNPDPERVSETMIESLEMQHPGITSLPPRDKEGYFLIENY